jgi:hypothetical protein
MPTVGPHAWIGAIPIVVGMWFGWQAVRGRRTEALAAFAAGAVAFLGLIAGRASAALEDYKVPRYFAEEVGLRQTDKDIRIGAFGWLRHSMVFYARREVSRFYDAKDVNDFLALPRPAYVIVPEDAWELVLSKELAVPVTIIARRYDMYIQKDVLVIANRYAVPE